MKFAPHILLAPLDWGLGHATRSIPLIEALLTEGAQITLAGAGRSLALLKDHFPILPARELPAYRVRYARHPGCLLPKLAWQAPRLMAVIRQEHRALRAWARELNLDGVIADNRYGLWHPKLPCVFVCHQLAPMVPGLWGARLRPGLAAWHRRMIRRFDHCWVPDWPQAPGLAGSLAHGWPLSGESRFIGPLSRFQNLTLTPPTSLPEQLLNQAPQVVVILSGPEPQRSLLEARLWAQAAKLNKTCCLVQGKPESRQVEVADHRIRISFLDATELAWVCQRAQVVISRSGYSSLMDYEALGLSRLILVPTPGQTEQQYLAQRWRTAHKAVVMSQKDFDLPAALEATKALSVRTAQSRPVLYPAALHEFMDQCQAYSQNRNFPE